MGRTEVSVPCSTRVRAIKEKTVAATNKSKIMNALERGSYSVAYGLLVRTGPILVPYDWGDDRLFDDARRMGIRFGDTGEDRIVIFVLDDE